MNGDVNMMKNITKLFLAGLCSISSVYAGNVSIENKNIINKCVIKFHNGSDADPASVVLGLPKAGQTAAREIPNENFALVVLECEMSDVPQKITDEMPKTMPHPILRPYCNAENPMDPVGSAKTLHISKDTPVLNISVEKPMNDYDGKQMKNNFSCRINNLADIN